MRRLIKRGLYSAGHYGRRLRQLRFPGVAVLCYHGVRGDGTPPGDMAIPSLHVPAAELEEHCRLIAETCHPISLADWRAALAGGAPLPERPVLVTFDDGYRSVHRDALPILARHRIPAAVFICTEPIERKGLLWFDAVARARGEAEVERLKAVPFEAWQQAVAELDGRPAAAGDPNAVLSVAELRALAAAPGIEIGGHTASHPILARAGLAHQREEIASSKRRIEEWLDRETSAFAYPNGRAEDYTAETRGVVADSGYDVAFTSCGGFSVPGEPPFDRSRFLMLAGISGAELAHRLSYSWLLPALASAS